VSNGAARPAVSPEWDRLQGGVQRLLEDHRGLRERARAAEQRVAELEATLRGVTSGAFDPEALSARVHALEEENRSLLQRVEQAREGVRKVVGRLQFIEENR
jgi:hypothetical protein